MVVMWATESVPVPQLTVLSWHMSHHYREVSECHFLYILY